jgi:hypothetical protein
MGQLIFEMDKPVCRISFDNVTLVTEFRLENMRPFDLYLNRKLA